MKSKQISTDWIRLRNDPANWLYIPEFNVFPIDVDFFGFSDPIIGEQDEDTSFHSNVREIVSQLRRHLIAKFYSISSFNKFEEGSFYKFKNDYESGDFSNIIPVGDDVFAIRYQLIIESLSDSIKYYHEDVYQSREAISFAMMEMGNMLINAELDKNLLAAVFSERARKAANLRHAADPVQADKTFVEQCWLEWKKEPMDKNGKKKYRSTSAFAEDMKDKCQNLKNTESIKRWCREWQKKDIL